MNNKCIHEFTIDEYNHPVQCTKCGLFYVDIIDKAIANHNISANIINSKKASLIMPKPKFINLK